MTLGFSFYFLVESSFSVPLDDPCKQLNSSDVCAVVSEHFHLRDP